MWIFVLHVVSNLDVRSIVVVFITCGGEIVTRRRVVSRRVELFVVELSHWIDSSDESDTSAALGSRRLNGELFYSAPQLVVLSFEEFELCV